MRFECQNNSLISVIIPVYNGEKYIQSAIESVLNQSYNNVEVIVIDDGSTDRTAEIIEELIQTNSHIRFYKEENSGVSAARNLGLEKASGAFITYLDADDYIDINYLSTLYECQKNSNLDLVCCGYRRTNNRPLMNIATSQNNIDDEDNHNVDCEVVDGFNAIELLLYQKGITNSCWGKLFKRSLLTNAHFENNIKYAEDLLFIFNVLQAANRVGIVNKDLYYYFQNPESVMHEEFNEGIFDKLYVADVIYSRIVKKFGTDSSLTKAARHRRFISYLQVFRDIPIDDNRYIKVRCEIKRNIQKWRWNLITDGCAKYKNRLIALSTYLPVRTLCFLGRISRNKI